MKRREMLTRTALGSGLLLASQGGILAASQPDVAPTGRAHPWPPDACPTSLPPCGSGTPRGAPCRTRSFSSGGRCTWRPSPAKRSAGSRRTAGIGSRSTASASSGDLHRPTPDGRRPTRWTFQPRCVRGDVLGALVDLATPPDQFLQVISVTPFLPGPRH